MTVLVRDDWSPYRPAGMGLVDVYVSWFPWWVVDGVLTAKVTNTERN